MHVLGKNPIPPAKKNGPVTTKTPRAAKIEEPEQAIDELDQFAKAAALGNRDIAIMLMFWKNRHQESPFTMDVSLKDLQGFEECIKYLDVVPQIKVFRPQGKPAHPGSPATETRSAIPPSPAGKPKAYVVVQMVDQEGNAFVPIENNEDDLARGQEAKRIQRIRESAPQLAGQLMADLQSNTTSNATITEAAEALKLLARA